MVSTAVGALVLVVGGTATPAFAHAELVETVPANGTRLDAPPPQVILTYSEAVDPPDDALEVFDSHGDEVKTSDPSHPDGAREKVAVDLPELEDGAYVVTWAVTSEDSHPIRGAFTFRVGDVAAGDEADADELLDDLVASQGGDRSVGVLFGLDRFAGFVGMVLLAGGAVFLVVLWPQGLVDNRANRLLAGAWITTLVTTVLAFGFQAAYTEGSGFSGMVDSNAISDVMESRPGRVWLLRMLVLVVIAFVGAGASRRLAANGGRLKSPTNALAVTAGLGLVLLATITFAGHAAAGDWVPVAIVTDLVHLGAISVWLGGLTTLFVVVLRRIDPDSTPAPPASTVGAASAVTDADLTAPTAIDRMAVVVARFSRWALIAVALVVVSGTVQGWRQLGSVSALFDTTYGRVLIVKVVLVVLLLGAAFVSREWVYRRRAAAAAAEPDAPAPRPPLSVRTLRRSVGAEVVVAALVLAVTALLVNTIPGKDAVPAGAYEAEQHGDALLVDVLVDPAKAGPADLTITALTHTSEPFPPVDLEAFLELPARDLPPIEVRLESSGSGVYEAKGTEIPYSGDWTLRVEVRTGEFATETFSFQMPVE